MNMNKKINLLLVSHDGRLSGASKSLLVLANRLDRSQYQLHSLMPSNGKLSAALRKANVPVTIFDRQAFTGSGWNAFKRLSLSCKIDYLLNSYNYVRKAANLILCKKIDIVYVCSVISPWAAIAGRLCGAKVLWHIQEGWLPSFVLRWYMRLVKELADRAVFASKATRDSMTVDLGVRPFENSTVIYTGVNPKDFSGPFRGDLVRSELGLNSHHMLVGLIGNLGHRKGLDVFITAAESLFLRYPKLRFLLVGGFKDSDLRNRTLEWIKRTGIEESVLWLGYRKDVLDVIDALDILVVPSRRDPFPWVVLEGMAMGKAIVGSKVDGISEALDHMKTGVLVPAGAPSLLAKSIESLLQRPVLLEELGSNAKNEVFSSFSEDSYVDRMSQVFDELSE